jgi:tetratricopeptide (TPR) repeat protein
MRRLVLARRAVVGPLRGACLLALALAVSNVCARSAKAEPTASDGVDEGDVDRAEALAAQAFAAYAQQDYAAAVSLYRQAYDASRSADILFNIARIYDIALRDRSAAMTFYQQYIIDPDAEDERVDIAFERIAALEPAHARARSGSASTGADRAPPRRAAMPLPAPARVDSKAEPWTALRVGAIVAGTVGLVGVGLGAGFGVAALSDASTAREYCNGDVCRSQQGLDAVRAASKNADIATVSFVLGGSLIAAGAAMLWLEGDGAPGSREVARLEWSPRVTSSELGLGLSGSW